METDEVIDVEEFFNEETTTNEYARKVRKIYSAVRNGLVAINNHRRGYTYVKRGDAIEKKPLASISNEEAYQKVRELLEMALEI